MNAEIFVKTLQGLYGEMMLVKDRFSVDERQAMKEAVELAERGCCGNCDYRKGVNCCYYREPFRIMSHLSCPHWVKEREAHIWE